MPADDAAADAAHANDASDNAAAADDVTAIPEADAADNVAVTDVKTA